MNLSPRNLLGARAMLLSRDLTREEDGLSAHGKRVREVMMYRCTTCDELYDDEFDAEHCCDDAFQELETAKRCPVCGEFHDTYFAAVDCCLWIDLDFAARLKVASALDNGSDWKKELALA